MRKNDDVLIIWGCGYIGFSDMIFFGKKGIRCIGFDIDTTIKDQIMKDNYKNDLRDWLGFDYKFLFENKMLDIVSDTEDFLFTNIKAYFICVPTESDGKPDMRILFHSVHEIIQLEKKRETDTVAVLIESTTTPGTVAKIYSLLTEELDKKVIFGSAPRRDWFLDSGKTIETVPRILGADSLESTEYFYDLLKNVCHNIITASSYQTAEMTKTVENAFRHLDITFANQLADAFPHVDIREVLALAGTKWNINTYYPSFGTGGYCIPLSSEYIIEGAMNEENNRLPLLELVSKYDLDRKTNIADDILPEKSDGIVCFLGIAYKADISVAKNSPALFMIKRLRERGLKVYVNDVMIEDELIGLLTNSESFCIDQAIHDLFPLADAIVVYSHHSEYSKSMSSIVKALPEKCHIYDSAFSKDIAMLHGNYHVIGMPSWYMD